MLITTNVIVDDVDYDVQFETTNEDYILDEMGNPYMASYDFADLRIECDGEKVERWETREKVAKVVYEDDDVWALINDAVLEEYGEMEAI